MVMGYISRPTDQAFSNFVLSRFYAAIPKYKGES